MTRNTLWSGLLLSSFSCAFPALLAAAETGASAPNPSPFFQSHEPMELRIAAPFAKMNRHRGEDRPYYPATITYKDASGQEVSIELKMRVRGKYRAREDICDFPPLRINFQKEAVAGTIFEGEDKLKLVTHCRANSRYEQFVLLEYTNYRILNQLTEYGLNARPLLVEYYETDWDRVMDTKRAFIIEDEGRFAERLGLEPIETEKMDKDQYLQSQLHLVTVFEYLVGNTDYSLVLGPPDHECCHNIVPFAREDGAAIPVPYDFDATGMVNAPYVAPNENLGLRSSRERLYRGYCQNTEGFQKTFAVFQEKKQAIYDLYDPSIGFDDRTIASAKRYIDLFYETISDPDRVVAEFINECR